MLWVGKVSVSIVPVVVMMMLGMVLMTNSRMIAVWPIGRWGSDRRTPRSDEGLLDETIDIGEI